MKFLHERMYASQALWTDYYKHLKKDFQLYQDRQVDQGEGEV